MKYVTHLFFLLFFTGSAVAQGLGTDIMSQGSISRAQFTSKMDSREPVDNIAKLSSEKKKIYFFTDLRNFEGETVTHRWEYNGTVMAEINFTVSGNRWRVYSSKNLEPYLLGKWSVTVIDSKGNTLQAKQFEYTSNKM